MQTRKRSSMRGASVVGVLALLAILSAAAIAIDSQSLITAPNSSTLTAATEVALSGSLATNLCRTLDGKQVCNEEKAQPKDTVTKCTPGHSFLITEKKGSPQPDVKVVVADQSVVNACKSTTPETKPLDASVGGGQVAAVFAAGDQCKDWRCGVEYCVATTVSGKEEVVCRKIPTSYAPNEEVNAEELKKGRKAGLESMLFSGDPKLQQLAAGVVVDAPRELQEGILGPFDERASTALITAQTQEQKNIEMIDERLRALADGCGKDVNPVLVSTNPSIPCHVESQQLQVQRAEAVQRLEALQETQRRLSSAATALQAEVSKKTSDEPPSNDDINRYLRERTGWTGANDQPWYTTRPAYSDYGAYSDYERGQLEGACRNGNQQACQQLAGGGARPGYGAAGTQQCGSTGGTGGLIGTIVSLFRKSDNNSGAGCTNGVPNPSCTITASPTSVATPGQPVQLSWQSQNAFSASLSNAGNVPAQGNMTVNPQQTTTYTMFIQGYRNNQTGQTLSGQCQVQVKVGESDSGSGTGEGTDPKAQISCAPQVADVGMSIAISFGCQNSSTSGGTGFSTNGQLSGSATPVVEAPTLGSNSITYGLTCSKGGKTDTAQCTVNINKASIVLVSNPKVISSGQEANIGWVTSGMESCRLWSPTLNEEWTGEDGNTANTSGVAKTPALVEDTHFQLDCTTKAGGTKTAEVTVDVE